MVHVQFPAGGLAQVLLYSHSIIGDGKSKTYVFAKKKKKKKKKTRLIRKKILKITNKQ